MARKAGFWTTSFKDKRAAKLQAAEIADAMAPLMTNPSTSPQDLTDMLQRLSELHAAGVLSDDEYASKKAEILARM